MTNILVILSILNVDVIYLIKCRVIKYYTNKYMFLNLAFIYVCDLLLTNRMVKYKSYFL